MNKRVFIFPGQGAQYVGMAKDFYDTFSVAKETFEEASDLLATDFARLVFEGPEDELTQTKNSQPAIFVASFAMLRSLQQQYPHLEPWATAGLSLGEYTALCATKRLSFADGLKIVAARGVAMQEACLENPGQMRVVLGLDPATVAAKLPAGVWIANLNCPGQVVIAGASLAEAEEILKAQGAKRVVPLDVSGAFHTPLMRPAQEKLRPLLSSLVLQESPALFIMNVPGDVVLEAEAMREQLILQVASPTQWEKGMRKFDELGAELYLEIGPGKTLAGMNKKIGVRGETINIEKVSDLTKLCNC
jgi:[acyl-carrier-protein] S-malonyltransferase